MRRKVLQVLKTVLAVMMVATISTQVFATSMDDAKQDKQDAENNRDNAQQILAGLESSKANIEAYVKELKSFFEKHQINGIYKMPNKSELYIGQIEK